MTAAAIRPVTAADRDALSRFSCLAWAQPWTAEVEATIHALADELAHSQVLVAHGTWADERLLAVTAWRAVPQTSLCQSLVLAVQTGHRRSGHGRRLKQAQLDEARRAGCSTVISKVHWDNVPMLELNRAFGANVERSDEREYGYCLIRL